MECSRDKFWWYVTVNYFSSLVRGGTGRVERLADISHFVHCIIALLIENIFLFITKRILICDMNR